MSYVWKDGQEKRRELTAYPLKKDISLISPLRLSYLTVNQRAQIPQERIHIHKIFDEIYGYDKSPCAYVRYHVQQIVKQYEHQNRSEVLDESWLRSCGQMYDMLNKPLLDFGEFSKNVSDRLISLLPTELAKEYKNQRDKKLSNSGNETYRQKIFKAIISDNFDEFKDGKWKDDLPALDHNKFTGTNKLIRILFPQESVNRPPVYDYPCDFSGLDVSIWVKIGTIVGTSLYWNGFLYSKDQYKHFAEQNKHVKHYSKRQQQKEALRVRENLVIRGALNTLLKSSLMASCCVAGYLYPIVYTENESTFMNLSVAPGLGLAAGLAAFVKVENSLNFNSTISFGTQLKGLLKIPLYKIQSILSPTNTWQRNFKSTNVKSSGKLEFRPVNVMPVNRELKIWMDPRNSRSRNLLIAGSFFTVVYTHLLTFFQNRDAMSAAVFKKYNVIEPLEGSEEFVKKAQSIFCLNDSALAPFVSMKAAWKPLPEDPIQRPYNLSETEDRIRHVEMLNLFLENLFPAESNVTTYGYEFEKNIFKTQAAKSYIYPS